MIVTDRHTYRERDGKAERKKQKENRIKKVGKKWRHKKKRKEGFFMTE